MQGKTKAKKRYLKAKKERRKNRKAVVVKGEHSGEPSTRKKRDESSSFEGESSESEDDASGNESEVLEPAPPKRGRKDEPRPKKRRKLDTPDAEDVPRATTPEDTSIPLIAPRPRSPTPPATLPIFPQPRKPDAPSKTVLALQGLDKALIEAQVVDPATTLPLEDDQESHNERTGLSGKMRKRLQELGIAELFAGQHSLFVACSEKTYQGVYGNSTDCGRAITPFIF